jgi:hypothetical protein
MKSHVLDYVFKFHRQKIQSNTSDKTKLEEYIYDLENTWSINTEILNTMLKENNNFTQDSKIQLFSTIERIRDLVAKKKSLRENKMKIRGKLLMDKQIMEEYKRRNEENNAYYNEQMGEHKENLEKKESFIKQFLKKFNEVEVYVQRESKNYPNKWENLETFEIAAFINENETLHKIRLDIIDEMNSVREDMNAILRENVEMKKRDEYIENSDDNDDQNIKYVTLVNNYEKKIKYFENNNENLRNVLQNLTSKFEKINSVSMFRLNKPLRQHQRHISLSVPGHKKINSKAEIFFRDLNVVNENKEENLSHHSDKIIEDANEHNEEPVNEDIEGKHSGENEKKEQEKSVHNQSGWELNLVKKKNPDDSIINNDDQSIFNQNLNHKNTAEMSFNKEHWDISCIENV